MKFNRKQWQTLIVMGAVKILCAFSISIMAPLYPPEAEQKGASATEYGFVFASYSLIQFIASPIVGKNMRKYGLQFILTTGMMLRSIAQIFIGLLDYVENTILFIGLSMVLRMVESLGSTCGFVCGYSVAAAICPNDVGAVFGIFATLYSIGIALGPILAGVLYALGGFPLPLISVGLMSLFIAFAVPFCVTNVTEDYQENEIYGYYEMKSVSKLPKIVIHLVSVCILASAQGFYTTLLEPFLRQFQISLEVKSILMAISGLTYAISAPIFGKLIDKGLEPRTLMIYSCVLMICSFMIIGPAPFLQYRTTIPSSILALIMAGIGTGSTVATFLGSLESAWEAGFPDTFQTYAFISGLWMSSNALGNFIGESGAGILYDLVGFRWATQFPAVCFICLLPMLLIYLPAVTHERNYAKERTPLMLMSRKKATLSADCKESLKPEA